MVTDTVDDDGTSLDVSWDQTGATRFDHYNVYISNTSISSVSGMDPEQRLQSSTENFTFLTTIGGNPLAPATDYHVAVTINTTDGGENETVMAVGPVQAVDDLPLMVTGVNGWDTPADEGGTIDLFWDTSTASDLDHYNIYLETTGFNGSDVLSLPLTPFQTVAAGLNSTQLTGLENVTCWIAVTAVDVAQQETDLTGVTGAVINLTPSDELPPLAITGLQVIDAHDDSGGLLLVSWTASTVADLDRYQVYVGLTNFTDITGMTPAVELFDPTPTHTNVTIIEGTDHWVAVVAVDTSGNRLETVTAFGPVQSVDNEAEEDGDDDTDEGGLSLMVMVLGFVILIVVGAGLYLSQSKK
jgi:hypothetical protein